MESMQDRSKRVILLRPQTLMILTVVAMAVFFVPLRTEAQIDSTLPKFKIFSDKGEVNLEKGIYRTTQRLFVGASDPENVESNLQCMVSLTFTTLMQNELGRGTVKAGGRIPLKDLLQNQTDGAKLKLEIVEYKTKDLDGKIETIKLEEPVAFKIPLI